MFIKLPMSRKLMPMDEINDRECSSIEKKPRLKKTYLHSKSISNINNNLGQKNNSYCSLSIALAFSDLDLLEIIGQGRFGPIKRAYVGRITECMVHCAKGRKFSL